MDINKLYRDQWAAGQLMAFSGLDGPTDYEHGLTARTTRNGIDIMLPGACTLSFPETTKGSFLIAGDFFEINAPPHSVKGAFLDAHHFLLKGPCRVTASSDQIAIVQRSGLTLIGTRAKFDERRINDILDNAIIARRRWLVQQRIPTESPEAKQYTLAKALSLMKTQVYTPQGNIQHRWTTPDRWPHRALWLWDSAFHALGWRHFDRGLARDMIEAVLDIQRPDGFIAIMARPQTVSSITQPPILTFAAKLINDIDPVPDWIASIYPKLCNYIRWDLANRDSDGAGLVEWMIEGNIHCRSGESGMDNSPRFDSATRLDAVDFNSFLALECELLAGFALALKRADDARLWSEQRNKLCRLIDQRLWSEKEGFYFDFDVEQKHPSPVMANAGFLPLICGAAAKEQAARLAEHIRNPQTFGTPLPVPTIAAKDTLHYSKDMWRGPVWINMNWLIAYGFDRYGMADIANDIREKTMRAIEHFYEIYGCLFEFYDDRNEVDPPRLLRKGKLAPEESPFHQCFHDYGWTATLYADMMLTKYSR